MKDQRKIPESTTIDLEQLLSVANQQERKTKVPESETDNLPPGFLTPNDVCRLFCDGDARADEGPTARARRLIADKNLPLISVGPGRWQVAHSLDGPR